MGYFRLFRRIKIAPGVTINVSKSGLSTSFGPKGAKITVGRRGVRRTVGIPGTGLYYTSTSGGRSASGAAPPPSDADAASGSAPRSSSRSWIVALIGLLIFATIVGSCLGGKRSDTGSSTTPAALGLIGQTSAPTPTPTEAPLATEAPTATATATPKQPADLSIKVTRRTSSVAPGGSASVTIKTAAKATCSIDVQYASGSSTAAGLGDKTASSTGLVAWTWRVGSRMARGTWPIDIACEIGDRSGNVGTEFTVR